MPDAASLAGLMVGTSFALVVATPGCMFVMFELLATVVVAVPVDEATATTLPTDVGVTVVLVVLISCTLLALWR